MPWPNPMRAVATGHAVDPWGNAIDMTRPELPNPDGSFSTEITATEQFQTPDGLRYINFPTVVGGQRLSLGDAVAALLAGQNQPTGIYATAPEAEQAAVDRSAYLGALAAFKHR